MNLTLSPIPSIQVMHGFTCAPGGSIRMMQPIGSPVTLVKNSRMHVLATALWFCSPLVSGASLPPPLPSIERVPTTLPFPIISTINMGQLAVMLEQTSLVEVRDAIGKGTIQHSGDAGSSQYWICYTSSMKGMNIRTWFISSELGGVDHIVDRFYAATTEGEATPDCPELPFAFQPISLGKVPFLDSDQGALKQAFGEASAKGSAWLLYSAAGASANRDQIAFLGARISDGKIDSLFLTQTTTN